MNICISTRMLRNGGTERVIAQLSFMWKALGHRVVILTTFPQMEDEFPYTCDLRQQFEFEVASDDEVIQIARQHQAELMIFNGGWNNRGFNRQIRLLKEEGVKIVCINHHSFSNWAFYLNNVDDFNKDELREVIDALVCVNPVQAVWWHTRGFKTVFIPNPVALNDVSANRYQHCTKLVWVGRPRDIGKRLPLMMEAYTHIRKRIKDVTLVVVGEASKESIRNFERLLPVHDRGGIVWYGYSADVKKVYLEAGVHVMTSELEVTSPQVLLEAVSCGVPTVMYELPCCFDATREHGVIQVNDTQQFVDEVCRLLEDSAYARQMSEKAFAWGTARSETDIVDRWGKLLSSVATATVSYILQEQDRYLTPYYYSLALKEVCRSESYFVKHYFHVLEAYKAKRRWIDIFKRKIRQGISKILC